MRSEKLGGAATGSALTPELLEEYWPVARERLVNALGHYGIDVGTAEDAVAEAVTRALTRRLAVDDLEHFCRWAFVVARNVAVDSTRRTRLTVLVHDPPERADDYDLAAHVESRVRWEATADAMKQLSAVDRAALLQELRTVESTTRREAVKQAVRRHRARARLRHALGQVGGWLGWLRRPTWPWAVASSTSLEGLAAIALLPLLAATSFGFEGAGGHVALPVLAAAPNDGLAVEAPPAGPIDRRAATPAPRQVASQGDVGPALVGEASINGWRFEFTPSPSYQEDHTVFANGGARCDGTVHLRTCSLLYVSNDGGATWRSLPASARRSGRLLLPPSYPQDPRIFSSSMDELSVSADGGQTFSAVTAVTGPATISPLFSAGDPRFVFGSDRNQRSPLPMQYREGDPALAPLDIPLPPTAAAMELWFAGSYASDGRMFVGVLEAPTLVGPGTSGLPRVAVRIPALYSCTADACDRVIDFGFDTLSPMLTWSPAQPETVFAGSTSTLHRSFDGGLSFRSIGLPGTDPMRLLGALAASPDGRLYAKVHVTGGYQQLWASDDDGETWQLRRNEPSSFSNLAVLPDGKLLEGRPTDDGNGVRCSVDGGRTWSAFCGFSR